MSATLVTKRIQALTHQLAWANNVQKVSTLAPESRTAWEEYSAKLQAELDRVISISPIEQERDCMPSQVALELLCSPGVPTTNRLRKNCKAALSTFFISQSKPKPAQVKLASRFSTATISQLAKRYRRAVSRAAVLLKVVTKLKSSKTPENEKRAAQLSVPFFQYHLRTAIIEDELSSRKFRLARSNKGMRVALAGCQEW
jgi:hypothetical protein